MARHPPTPCRLFVYLARDAPLGVVLRRGPSAWARLSLWHTDTDRFEHGQWIHARVYERRCDLSPDGSLFVAFVRAGHGPTSERPVDSWLAISRAPFFTALAVWWVGGTYCAGGYFSGPRALWLPTHGHPDQGALPPSFQQAPALPQVFQSPQWPDRLVYFNRLLRDGWTTSPEIVAMSPIWEHIHYGQTLRMDELSDSSFTAFGGPHIVDYNLTVLGQSHALGRATWGDWDQQGRLVLARDGRLVHILPGEEERLIYDFNSQEPEAIAPPRDALRWP